MVLVRHLIFFLFKYSYSNKFLKQYCVNYIKKIRTFRSKKNNFEYNPWFFLALGKYVETKNNRRSDKRKRKRLRGCDSNIPKKAISCFWSGIDIFFFTGIFLLLSLFEAMLCQLYVKRKFVHFRLKNIEFCSDTGPPSKD